MISAGRMHLNTFPFLDIVVTIIQSVPQEKVRVYSKSFE